MTTNDHHLSARPPLSRARLFPSRLLSGIALLLFALAAPASDLGQLLAGKDFPLAVKLKDLNGDWRRVTIRGSGSVSGNVSVNVSGSARSTSQNNLVGSLGGGQTYVTKGQTASAGGQIYLVAYHLPVAGLDLAALLQALATKAPPASAVLTPDTALPLSLLELRTAGSIDDVRPFDMNREIADSQKALKALAALFKGEEKKPAEEKP